MPRSPAGRPEEPQGLGYLIVVAATTGAVLGIGSLVLQRWVAQTRGAAMILVVIWFVVVAVAVAAALRRKPRGRNAAFVALGLALVVTVAVGYWTGFRETEVNEDVVVATGEASEASDAGDGRRSAPSGAVSLGTGEIEGADGHAGSGTAELVELGSGERVLTLTDLSVDPGPDVDVLLSPSAEDIDDAINLGGLKGSSGNQQYQIPADADLRENPNVILYCNPFTVRIAVAELDV